MQQYAHMLCSWSGRPARPRTQHDDHHFTKVKPEAATAVIELLMMGGKTPETHWAVNKRQDNKLENCCIWLVIYLNWGWWCLVHVTCLGNVQKNRKYKYVVLLDPIVHRCCLTFSFYCECIYWSLVLKYTFSGELNTRRNFGAMN